MKALVLCAGRGTRLRPLTHTRSKAALPVAGRPVLQHILAYLYRHGFTDVGVVISPDQGELRRIRLPGVQQRVTFVVQKQPKGIADAVRAARTFLGEEPFLLYLGDNLTSEELAPMMARFHRDAADAVIAVRTVQNPQAFGVAELEGSRVVRVVEKPAQPASNLAIAGLYLFGPEVHEAIERLEPSARGEYEITDAIASLIADGRQVQAHRMTGWWQDMGSPAGMLAANVLLLDRIALQIAAGVSLETAEIQGRVVIGEDVTLENVRLRGPLLIGSGCRLKDAYVGPYTSVGEGAVISGASVENSILLPGCRLEGPSFHMEGCLLGAGAAVEVRSGRSVTLLIGDDGRLQLPPWRG